MISTEPIRSEVLGIEIAKILGIPTEMLMRVELIMQAGSTVEVHSSHYLTDKQGNEIKYLLTCYELQKKHETEMDSTQENPGDQ